MVTLPDEPFKKFYAIGMTLLWVKLSSGYVVAFKARGETSAVFSGAENIHLVVANDFVRMHEVKALEFICIEEI
jgi:hypothetical protein